MLRTMAVISSWDTLVRDDVTATESHLPEPIAWPRSKSGIVVPDEPSEIGFDEEHHRYVVDGKVVPSVTTIIKELVDYSMIPPLQLQWAADRGTAAHKAVELWDADDLDLDALDPRLTPYVHAWMLFRSQSGWKTEASEQRVHHPLYGYCGTLDQVGHLPGQPSGILDLKTTSAVYLDYCALQTEAYRRAWNYELPSYGKATRRYIVQLKADGSYRLHEFTGHATDWARFRQMLQKQEEQRESERYNARLEGWARKVYGDDLNDVDWEVAEERFDQWLEGKGE